MIKIKIKNAPEKCVISDNEINKMFSNKSEFEIYDIKKPFFDSFDNDELKSIQAIDFSEYSYIDIKHLVKSENSYESNNFIVALECFYGKRLVQNAITKYRLGTSQAWKGFTIFWYIDIKGRICSGKIRNYKCLYEESIVFNEKPLYDSVRSILYEKGVIDDDFNQRPTLFGEHLLKDNQKPVAIVESEKTAVMASLEYPDFTWLATGIDSHLTYDKVKVLEGFDVTLCPNDQNFKLWYKKAIEYGFKISLLTKHELSWKENPKADLSDWILEGFQMDEYYRENQD